MQNPHQPDALAACKREFSQAVDEINAGILATGEPSPTWTQDDAIAFESARECITHLMAICTDELHNRNATSERRTEVDAERQRLARELRELHVHDHAKIERIRRDYGQRIRARCVVMIRD